MRKHLAYLMRIAQFISARYEKSAEPTARIRLSEVAQAVADDLDVCVSASLRRDVAKAARLAGFTRIVATKNVRRYVGMTRKDQP